MLIEKTQGRWLTVEFEGGQALEVQVKPDGPSVENALALQSKIDQSRRLDRRLEKLSARLDAEDLSPDDFQRLSREFEQWEDMGRRGLEPTVDAFLLAAVEEWRLYVDNEAAERDERLPVNEETVGMLPFAKRVKIVTAVQEFMMLADREGKGSSASSPDGSPTQTEKSEQSPDSTSSISSPASTASPLPM